MVTATFVRFVRARISPRLCERVDDVVPCTMVMGHGPGCLAVAVLILCARAKLVDHAFPLM